MTSILEIKRTCLAGMSQDEIKAYLDDNNFEWKDWYFKPVYTPSRIVERYTFWKEKLEYVTDISPRSVIGHHHGSISSELNWITLLSCLKRHVNDTDPVSVLKMLKEQKNLPDNSDGLIHLEKYGELFFFSAGRHRIVQAKFLEVETIHCRVTEYVFDKEAYDLYSRVQAKTRIIENENWRLGLPIKAQLEEVTYEIPLTEYYVAFFEKAFKEAKILSKRPLARWLFTIKNKMVENACTYYNLENLQSSETLVRAILLSMK